MYYDISMINALKERASRLFNQGSKALTREAEKSIGPVDKEKLWVNAVNQVLACIKTNGFYFEIEETPPPFMDVMFGVFCEVALVDEIGVGYEVGLMSFHYPGDKRESQIMQIKHKGYMSHTFVTVRFRSNLNLIRLTPDSEVKKSRWISNYPNKLDLNEEIDLLSRLSRAIVDEERTLELFNEKANRSWSPRSVAWIKDMLSPPGLLE